MSTRTWKVLTVTSDWSNPANWEENSTPEDHDDIVIPASDPNSTPSPIAPAGFRAKTLNVQGQLSGGPINVESDFSWSGGNLWASVVIADTASGRVHTLDSDVEARRTWLGGFGSITNHGTLSIDAGRIGIGGGAFIDSYGLLEFASGCAFFQWYGSPSYITSRQALIVLHGEGASFAGWFDLRLIAGSVTLDGPLITKDGSSITLGGASISGGSIIAAKDGIIHVAATTKVPLGAAIRIVGGRLDTPGVAGQAAKLVVEGELGLSDGVLAGTVELGPTGVLGLEPPQTCALGQLDLTNEGVQILGPGSRLIGSGGTRLINRGRLELTGDVELSSQGGGNAQLINVGLLQKTGDGDATLRSWDLTTTTSQFVQPPSGELRRGVTVVAKGTLTQIGIAHFTVEKEAWLHLDGGEVAASVIIADGGRMTGHGSVRGMITNNGWLYPDGAKAEATAQVVLTGDLECGATAHLVVAPSQWHQPPRQSQLTVSRDAILGGSLWAPQAPADGEVLVITGPGVRNKFERVPETDTTRPTIIDTTASERKLKAFPLTPQTFHGIDYMHYATDPLMQSLYDNGPWSFVALYAVSPHSPHWGDNNRNDSSWVHDAGILTTLRQQGWGLMPVYFCPNYSKTRVENPHLTPADAVLDAQDAGAKFSAISLEAGSVIYLDVEPETLDAQDGALDYVSAWATELESSTPYKAGLYTIEGTYKLGAKILALRPTMSLWTCLWPNPDPFIDLDAPHSIDSFRRMHRDGSFDADQQPSDLVAHSTPRMPFRVWQYYSNTAHPSSIRWIDDQGLRQSWLQSLDFNVADCPDPSRPEGPAPRSRAHVDGLVVEPPSIAATGTGQLTITLAAPAAPPLGVIVVLSSSDPALQVPASVAVPAGKMTVTVTVTTVLVQTERQIRIQARALHQLGNALNEVAVTVT